MSIAAEIADRLARNAEAVCRHYLPHGRREGRYWLVGDVAGTPGRSLYVRLRASVSTRGSAGKWTDAATGEHGDLLDLIAANMGVGTREAIAEARRFLALPVPAVTFEHSAPQGSPSAARRLWAISQPIAGTLAERYLRNRGISAQGPALRFHPRCWYCPDQDDPPGISPAWPALVAAVTDPDGQITGLHRTWLDPSGGKAPVATPRRAMGMLLGQGVRVGQPGTVLGAGEGLETILSLRTALPALPVVACLSANHLAALELPACLSRLYIARDPDPAGARATEALSARARALHIKPIIIDAQTGDLNDDLRQLGLDRLRSILIPQLDSEDVRLLPG